MSVLLYVFVIMRLIHLKFVNYGVCNVLCIARLRSFDILFTKPYCLPIRYSLTRSPGTLEGSNSHCICEKIYRSNMQKIFYILLLLYTFTLYTFITFLSFPSLCKVYLITRVTCKMALMSLIIEEFAWKRKRV